MLDLLSKIKKKLLLFLSLNHLILTIAVMLYLYFLLNEEPTQVIFSGEVRLLVLSVGLFFIWYILVSKYLERTFGSQREFSITILKKTRNIINNISHEIRTPLNAIIGFADTLFEQEQDLQKKESLRAIRDNGDRLFSLAKKLIDLSSIETDQFVVEKDYFSCDSLLEVLENKYSGRLKQKNLAFVVNNSIPANYRVYSDYAIVFEILEMLFENAVKFTETGSISIDTSYERGSFICKICDTGCGVPEEKKDVIFHIYKQGTSELNRDYEGLGLGLTIAERLTHLLGGKLQLQDNIGTGSCFTLSIKMSYNEYEQDERASSLIPDNLSDEKKKMFTQAVHSLNGCIKVFNPDKIKIISLELAKISDDFIELSKRIKKTAETYNESEFSSIVEDMLKGIENEE